MRVGPFAQPPTFRSQPQLMAKDVEQRAGRSPAQALGANTPSTATAQSAALGHRMDQLV
jgi:hypothetical protein